jgi:hypothetical protein
MKKACKLSEKAFPLNGKLPKKKPRGKQKQKLPPRNNRLRFPGASCIPQYTNGEN